MKNIIVLAGVITALNFLNLAAFAEAAKPVPASFSLKDLQCLFDRSCAPKNSDAVPTGVHVAPSQGGDPWSDTITPEALKKQMVNEFHHLVELFQATYAPEAYKTKAWHLNFEAQEKACLERIEALKLPAANDKEAQAKFLNDYHQIIIQFKNAMRDYHVGVIFESTARSELPISIMPAVDGKGKTHYLIARIDRAKLPNDSADRFALNIGDEIKAIGGKNIFDEVAANRKRLGDNNPDTDQRLAAIKLTRRSGPLGDPLESGSVVISVAGKGSARPNAKVFAWSRSPELFERRAAPASILSGPAFSELARFDSVMSAPIADVALPQSVAVNQAPAPNDIDPNEMSGVVSFVPPLGKIIWPSPLAENECGGNFHAYEFLLGGRTVGYIRIPSYAPENGDQAAQTFACLIAKFDRDTSALVIDQVNNPGGSLFYAYAILSHLAARDQALMIPKHRVAITSTEYYDAAKFLAAASQTSDDLDGAKNLFGPSLDGFPVTYSFFQSFRDYMRSITEAWQNTRRLSDPLAFLGVAAIGAAPVAYNQNKPILMLINELDFSCADFVPTILHDNKRARLFGFKTAGAGGIIHSYSDPGNQVGIREYTITGSIAERTIGGGRVIENAGIEPDVTHRISVSDVQNNFSAYKAAVDTELLRLLGARSGH